MPIVDGVDATRRIAKLLPSTRVVAYSGADDSGSVSAMTEAGAAAYCVKGAPLWELERAIAGRSDPLVRLAHGLARAVNRSSIGTIVARELLSLAGSAGAARARRLVAAPGLALRAYSTLCSVHADGDDLRELAQLGLHCSDALAVPLVSDGTVLGSLLVTMPPDTELVPDEEQLSHRPAPPRRGTPPGTGPRTSRSTRAGRAPRLDQPRRAGACRLPDLPPDQPP